MIEKFLSLFERFVIAVEAIASKAGPLAVPANEQAAPAAEGPKPSRSRAAAADKKKDEPKEQAPATDTSFDFLGGASAPAKKYERGDVKAALEKLVGKAGSAEAFKLFQAVGGVQSLNDLPEDKFATVIKAVEDELAKK
jgi:hypothetical protein